MLLVNKGAPEGVGSWEWSGRSPGPSTGEVELGGIEVLGHLGYPWLQSKFEAEISYTRPCLKEQNKPKGPFP